MTNRADVPPTPDRSAVAGRVFEQAVDLCRGDVAAARRWMDTPIPALGDRRPADVAGTEIGEREVADLIGRIRHGIVS